MVHTSTAAYTLNRMMLNTEGIRKGGRQQQRTVEREGGEDRSLEGGVGLVDWEGRRPFCGLVFEGRLVGSRVRVSIFCACACVANGEIVRPESRTE